MSTTKEKPTEKKIKPAQFRVTSDASCEHKPVQDRTEALSVIAELQAKNVSPIYLHDDKEEKTVCYRKERYEQNYRAVAFEYKSPQAQEAETKTVAEE